MLVWGGEPLAGSSGAELHDGPDGQKIGWASMESWVVVACYPRRGATVQSFSATIAVHAKTTHRILWAFDVDSEDLLIAFEVVDLSFDTVTRQAVPIPPDLRARCRSGAAPLVRTGSLPRPGRSVRTDQVRPSATNAPATSRCG